MSTADRDGALRLGARLLRRRSQELQARGQFVDAEWHHEAACELDGLRYALDPRMREMERHGGNARGGMVSPLDHHHHDQEGEHVGDAAED